MNRCDYVASAGNFAVSFDGRFWLSDGIKCESCIIFPDLSNALYYMYYSAGVKVSAKECVQKAARIKAQGERKAHNAWIMGGIEP